MDAVAEALTELITARGLTGLTGLSVGVAAVRVDLYWCGPVPAVIRRAAEGASARVVFHSVPYSALQLSTVIDQVMGLGPAGTTALTRQLRRMGISVFSGGRSPGYTGAAFTVGISAGRPVAATLRRAGQLITDTTGVRCSVVVGIQAIAM